VLRIKNWGKWGESESKGKVVKAMRGKSEALMTYEKVGGGWGKMEGDRVMNTEVKNCTKGGRDSCLDKKNRARKKGGKTG